MNIILSHPPTGKTVVICSTSVEYALLHFDGRREPVGVLKHITTSNRLAWLESQNEYENIQTMPDAERVAYLDQWTTFIDDGTKAVKEVMQYVDDIVITDKRSARLKKIGIEVKTLGWIEVTGKEVKLRPPVIDPSKGRLESIEKVVNYGRDNPKTYEIFTKPIMTHEEARTLYQPRHRVVGIDPSLSWLTDSVGYRDGKMENVLQALKMHRTYKDAESKKPFRSHVLNQEDPEALKEGLKGFIEANVHNKALKAMELKALGKIGPFDRYPVEYFKHKVAVSYDSKDTSFNVETFANAWSVVARIVQGAIDASNRDVARNMPGYKHLLFSPDPTTMSMERKRSTSNAGYPTFGKQLNEDEWEGFAREVDEIVKDPSKFDPTHYPMIVGCRVTGVDLKIPEGLTSEEEFNFIREENKQRVIQMGSSVEFILGTKFTHPLFRVISSYTSEFAGLKSWNNVKGPLSSFFAAHKAGGNDPLSLALGADASGFDASVTIFEWVMAKRLFQLVYPGYEEVLEFYFTMAAFSPTISLGKDRQPVVIEGCSGMASGVACTAVVDSLVQLARGIAVLMELGMIPNELGATIPKGISTYVCGDDLGVVVAKSCDNGRLTEGAFCAEYKKYGGEAHPDKQLLTTQEHDLGITLLFLKRLFSTDRKTVGWGTRLLSHAMNGIIYSNPADMTSSARVNEEFRKSNQSRSEESQEIFGLVALSSDAQLLFDGDLSLERRDYNQSVKKAAEANGKAKDLIKDYEAGRIIDMSHYQDLSIRWIYRVTHEDSLNKMVTMGIITEDQKLDQIEEGAKLKLYDVAKMHLIKAVQQVEECHPHPKFKEFAEWIVNMNPNFFNYDILLGDECREISTFLRASAKGEGLGTWKIMDILRTSWVSRGHVDTTDYVTRAFVNKIVDAGDHVVNYLRLLAECPSSPFDVSMKTTRMLLDRIYTHIGVCVKAKCFNAATDMTSTRNFILGMKTEIKAAIDFGDRSGLDATASDVEYFADTLSNAYNALKHFAVTRESVVEASTVVEPDDKN